MTIQDWAALTVSVLTIVAVVAGSIKWLVKHYLAELKPNSGSSLKDQVSRLEDDLKNHISESSNSRVRHEEKLDKMYDIILEHVVKNNK